MFFFLFFLKKRSCLSQALHIAVIYNQLASEQTKPAAEEEDAVLLSQETNRVRLFLSYSHSSQSRGWLQVVTICLLWAISVGDQSWQLGQDREGQPLTTNLLYQRDLGLLREQVMHCYLNCFNQVGMNCCLKCSLKVRTVSLIVLKLFQ